MCRLPSTPVSGGSSLDITSDSLAPILQRRNAKRSGSLVTQSDQSALPSGMRSSSLKSNPLPVKQESHASITRSSPVSPSYSFTSLKGKGPTIRFSGQNDTSASGVRSTSPIPTSPVMREGGVFIGGKISRSLTIREAIAESTEYLLYVFVELLSTFFNLPQPSVMLVECVSP